MNEESSQHSEHVSRLVLPAADDLHVHVRQGELMERVIPLLRAGGAGRCLVMPNTSPPTTSVDAACAYREAMKAIDPSVDYLMTLYLSKALTRDEILKAADAGITGVKLYPRGVTTHSDAGVDCLDVYAPVFAAMEEAGLVLEIHGECGSNPDDDLCVLNAESAFLPQVAQLHQSHPELRIVLEHVTTADAVALVSRLGDTVAATITVHHIDLTVDDWAGRNHNFCKPVAKYPSDRDALRRVIRDGHPRFFLGSDSAPHPRSAKECAEACAGIFTSALLLPYLADSFDALGCLSTLPDFATKFGRQFYGLEPLEERVELVRTPCRVPDAYGDIVPYRAGETLGWSLA